MRGVKAKIIVRRGLLYYVLRRLGLGTDPAARKPQDQQTVLLSRDQAPGVARGAEPSVGRARLMKTAEMVDRGRLAVGTGFTIKDHSDSAARVVDQRHVEYRSGRLSLSEWGRRATGCSAIQIGKRAVLPDDGRLLEALRLEQA